MSCVSSNPGAMMSEKSLLRRHLPGSDPNFRGAREGGPHRLSEHRCRPPALRASEGALPLFASRKIREARAGEEQSFGMLESSAICF